MDTIAAEKEGAVSRAVRGAVREIGASLERAMDSSVGSGERLRRAEERGMEELRKLEACLAEAKEVGASYAKEVSECGGAPRHEGGAEGPLGATRQASDNDGGCSITLPDSSGHATGDARRSDEGHRRAGTSPGHIGEEGEGDADAPLDERWRPVKDWALVDSVAAATNHASETCRQPDVEPHPDGQLRGGTWKQSLHAAWGEVARLETHVKGMHMAAIATKQEHTAAMAALESRVSAAVAMSRTHEANVEAAARAQLEAASNRVQTLGSVVEALQRSRDEGAMSMFGQLDGLREGLRGLREDTAHLSREFGREMAEAQRRVCEETAATVMTERVRHAEEMEAMLQQLQARAKAEQDVSGRLAEAEKRCASLEAKRMDSARQQEFVQAELGVVKAELGDAKAELGDAKVELSDANARMEALEDECNVLRAQFHARTSADMIAREEQAELNVLREYKAAVSVKIAAMSRSVSECRADGTAPPTGKDNVQTIPGAVSVMDAVVDTARRLGRTAKEEAEGRGRAEEDRDREVGAIRARCRTIEKEKHALAEEGAAAKREHERLQSAAREAAAGCERARKECRELRAQADAAGRELASEKEARARADAQAAETKGELDLLIGTRCRDEEVQNELRLSLVQAQERAESLQTSVAEANRRSDCLREAKSAVEAEFARANAEATSLRLTNEQLGDRLRTVLGEMHSGLEFAAGREAALTRLLDALDVKITATDCSIQRLVDGADPTAAAFQLRVEKLEMSLLELGASYDRAQAEANARVSNLRSSLEAADAEMARREERSAAAASAAVAEVAEMRAVILEKDAQLVDLRERMRFREEAVLKAEIEVEAVSSKLFEQRILSEAAVHGIDSMRDNVNENIALMRKFARGCGMATMDGSEDADETALVAAGDDERESTELCDVALRTIDDKVSRSNAEAAGFFKELYVLVSSLHRERSEHAATIAGMNEALDRARAEAQHLSENADSLAAAVKEIRGELEEKQRQCAELKIDAGSSRVRFDAEVADFRAQAAASDERASARIAELEQALEASRGETAKVSQRSEGLSDANDELLRCVETEKREKSAMDRLLRAVEAELETARGERLVAERALKASEERYAECLGRETERSRRASAKAQAAQRELSGREEEKARLSRELDACKERLQAERLSKLRCVKRASDLDAKLAVQREERELLAAKVEELTRLRDDAEKEMATHKASLSKLVLAAADKVHSDASAESAIVLREARLRTKRKVLAARQQQRAARSRRDRQESRTHAAGLLMMLSSIAASSASRSHPAAPDGSSGHGDALAVPAAMHRTLHETQRKIVALEDDIRDLCSKHAAEMASLKRSSQEQLAHLKDRLYEETLRADAASKRVDSETRIFSNPLLLIEAQQERAHHEQQTAGAKMEIAALTEELDRAVTDLRRLREDNAVGQEGSARRLEEARLEHAATIEELEASRERCASLAEEVRAAKGAAAASAAEIEAMSARLESSNKQVQRLHSEATHRDLDQMKVTDMRASLEAETALLRADIDKLRAEGASREEMLATLHTQSAEKDGHLDVSKDEVARLSGELADVEAELKAARAAHEEVIGKLSSLEAELETTAREMAEHKKRADGQEDTLIALHNELTEFVSRRRSANTSDEHVLACYESVDCTFEPKCVAQAVSRSLSAAEREVAHIRGLLDALGINRDRDVEYYEGRVMSVEAEVERERAVLAADQEAFREEMRSKAATAVAAAQREITALKERLGRRDNEILELNHMLKAWEQMRSQKDKQINELMQKCSRYEHESHTRTRLVHKLQRQVMTLSGDAAIAADGDELKRLEAPAPVL